MLVETEAKAVAAAGVAAIGRHRWRICGLLFFATTLNYMDRQALALLKPTLQDPVRGIGLTELQFAGVVAIFSAAYAIGLLIAGPFIDRVGTKIGYAVAVSVWTLASMSHALVSYPSITAPLQVGVHWLAGVVGHVPGLHSSGWIEGVGKLSGAVITLGIVRFVLGLGEAGNFPAAIKATAEWFPKKERVFATGIFNSGTNVGATVAPFVIGFLVYRLPWHWAFMATSGFALLWLGLWVRTYRSPQSDPGLSAAELAHINSDPAEAVAKISCRGCCRTGRRGRFCWVRC